MTKTILSAVSAALLISASASAQGYKPVMVVKTLPNMQCMGVANEFDPQGSFAPPPPEFAGPEASAPKIGIGAGTILVREPMRTVDGRTEVLRPNGQSAWIEVSALTRWHALAAPNATCEPVLLSNGRYGFSTKGG